MTGAFNFPGQYLEGIIEYLPDALVAIDNAGTVIAWNRAMESFTGVESGDVVGKGNYEYALPFYECRRPLLIDLLDAPVEQVKADYIDVRQDDGRLEGIAEKAKLWGEEAILWGMASRIYDERGNVIGAVETIRDFTYQMKIEKRLEKEKIRSEAFLDLLTHDVNNKNQIAIGFLELASPTIRPDGAASLLSAIRTLKEGSELVHRIDVAERLSEADMKPTPLDLGALLSEVKMECTLAHGKSLNIHYMPVQGCRVLGNRLLKELFSDIIGFSAKYATDRLNVSVFLDRVVEDGKNYCRVVIEEDGTGLPDRIKKDLFSPESPDAALKMYGLQLYLIKCLAEAAQCKARVEDRIKGDYRKGSRFVITLPAADTM